MPKDPAQTLPSGEHSGGVAGLVGPRSDVASVLDAARDAVGVVSLDCRFLYLNRSAAEMTGFPAEELYRAGVSAVLEPEVLARASEHARRVAGGAALPGAFPVELIRKDRTMVSIEASASLIHPGGVPAFVLVARALPGGEAGRTREPDGNGAARPLMTDIARETRGRDRILGYQARLRALATDQALADQRERRILAGALHDQISQTLAATKLELDAALSLTPSEAIRSRLQEIRAHLDQAIDDARALTIQISPPILHELGLGPALEWLADLFQKREGIAVRFRDDGRLKSIAPEAAGLVYQAARELLLDVLSHAEATNAEISLRRRGAYLLLDVSHDGRDLESEGPGSVKRRGTRDSHFAIRERLRLMGGRLRVRPGPGRGSRVTLAVPLPQAGEATP